MLSHVENRNKSLYASWKPVIKDRTVVFVGDAAEIGHATAALLAARGAPVFLAARSAAVLKQAFVDINKAGGECDGMVVDWSRPEEIRRFFMLAEAWLGGIDAVITPPAEGAAGGRASVDRDLCLEEAIRRMQPVGRGHIVNIDLARENGTGSYSDQRITSALRRQARELNIRITLIEPPASPDLPVEQYVARCVLDSLSQPYEPYVKEEKLRSGKRLSHSAQ